MKKEINLLRPRENKILSFLRFRSISLLVMCFIIVGLFLRSDFSYTKELAVINSADFSLIKNMPKYSISDKIREGQNLLRDSVPLLYRTRAGELTSKQIALAILNIKTGEIFETRLWVSEQDTRDYKKTGIINIQTVSPPEESIFHDDIVDVGSSLKINWWNSFNTDYSITDMPDLIVIANKYLFPSKYLTGLSEKSSAPYTDIIYTPYSSAIHKKEIINAGRAYLEENIDKAFSELTKKEVKSKVESNLLITDVISKDILRNIMVVEHIDPDGFRNSVDDGQFLGERVLAIIGANQELAYRYTGSPAGASGLAQFIEPTYDNMVSRYPEAKLIKDYNLGMANHVNAIQAMVLFFDSHKKDILSKITRKDITNSLGITEEMLAAAYNGGPGRVVNSVNKLGLAWFSSQLNTSSASRIFRQETLDYIRKFQAIKNLDLFVHI